MNRVAGIALLAALGAGSSAAYELLGPKWPTPAATFHVNILLNLAALSPSGTSWNAAFAQAAEKWNSTTNFSFTVGNSNPSHPCAGTGIGIPEDGGRNGAGFFPTNCGDSFGSSTLAITTTYFNPSNNQTLETDIVFNQNELWNVYDGPWQSSVSDFRRVAVHELGHALGLDHEFSQAAIMRAVISSGSTVISPLADDLNGVAALFGEPVGGSSSSSSSSSSSGGSSSSGSGSSSGSASSGGSSSGASNPPMRLSVEDPFSGSVKAGVRNLRGYLVALNPPTRLSLYIDGVFHGDLEHHGPRPDVGDAFPQYAGSGESGFNIALNFGDNIGPGEHTIRLLATDNLGGVEQLLVTFTVDSFDNPFVFDDGLVSLSGATVTHDSNDTITIQNLLHDGQRYRVRLKWTRQTQNYEAIEITPLP